MSKVSRVTTGIVLPPALAAAIFVALYLMEERAQIRGVAIIVGVAYVYAILPSVAYACVMEFAYSRGLSVRSWRAALLSSLLGGAAGLVIGAIFPEPSVADWKSITALSAVGVVVGAITGAVVIACSGKPPSPNNSPEATRGK